jgi:hypothetical protein
MSNSPLIPADDDVEAEAALADVIGGDHLLGGDHRIKDRGVHGTEYSDALGKREQPGCPGDRFERRALIIGLTAITLPSADRQQKVDAGLVGHQR